MMTLLFNKKTTFTLLIILAFFYYSCEDFIEIDPPQTEIVRSSVFSDNASANSALEGIYYYIKRSGHYASGSFESTSIICGIAADELIFNDGGDFSLLGENNIQASNSVTTRIWASAYKTIYYSNSAIEGLGDSNGVSPEMKKQLIAEAKFLRSFSYFYLVNLFGDVPLVLSTDYQNNLNSPRISSSEIYEQIIADLKDSQLDLIEDYSIWGGQRVRVNKWAATAMLARVYLYMGDWTNAEIETTKIINDNATYELLNNLDEIFLKNSKEVIWQLLPENTYVNTNEGQIFVDLNQYGPYVILNNNFLSGFEENDLRKMSWIQNFGSYSAPYKYKVGISPESPTEYSTVLRLAEQYLIRAEARAQQNNILGAQTDLNLIRNRAGLADTTAASKSELLLAIEQERKIELFSEHGHRWLDLKRWGKVDEVIGSLKPETWQVTDALFPIPQEELDKNVNLTQNPGYN